MKPRVLAISENPFERSLLLSLLQPDAFAVYLVDDERELRKALLGERGDVLVITEKLANHLGTPFFEELAQRTGKVLPIVLLQWRGVSCPQAVYSQRQAVLPFPCPRDALTVSLRSFLGISSTSVSIPPPQEEDPFAATRARVDAVFRDLEHGTHYSLLGVSPTATSSEILAAYRSRMAEFHPDRFTSMGDPSIHEQAEIICKRLNQAFLVLTHPPSRAAYDAK